MEIMSETETLYLRAMSNSEYQKHMNRAKNLGSEIMNLLDQDKSLFLEFEKEMWLASEILIEKCL